MPSAPISRSTSTWTWSARLRNLRSALTDLQRFLPGLAPRVRWHGQPLQPQVPDEGFSYRMFYEARLGGSSAVRARQAQVHAAARSAGLQIDFDAIHIFPNSRLACALINDAQTHLPVERMFDLAEAIYAAFFRQGKNIGQPEVLKALALGAELAWDPMQRTSQPPAHSRAYAGGVPHYEFNQQHPLTGAVPDSELLLVMAQAALAASRQG